MNPTQFKADGVEVRLRPEARGAVLEVFWFDPFTRRWTYRDVDLDRDRLKALHAALGAMLAMPHDERS